MKLKILGPIYLFTIVLAIASCTTSADGIIGEYEIEDSANDQHILYSITHVKENIYGIKVEVSFEGEDAQTDYLEGSYNPEERILTTKRSNVILNYKFSSDFETVKLLGDGNDLKLTRK